jgi:hypothetical protein
MTNFKRLSGAELIRKKRMIKKLDSYTRHSIVKNYLALKNGTGAFGSVSSICKQFNVSRNVPAKLLSKFKALRAVLYVDKEPDYTVNIFLQREKLRKHRKLPEAKSYKAYVKRYPRAGYQSYDAHCGLN